LFTHFCYKAPPAAAAKTTCNESGRDNDLLANFLNRKVISEMNDLQELHQIAGQNKSRLAKKAKKLVFDHLSEWQKLEEELSDEEKK